MPAKSLLGLTLLAVAAHEPARAEQEQFVVTYVEFVPAKQDPGEELLERLAALGRRNGAISFTANQQIQRPNFFVLLEIWPDATSRENFEDQAQVQRLLDRINRLLEVPFDERPGTLIE